MVGEKFSRGAVDLGEEKKGKMPRKGVEGLEILRGGVQKWRKTHIFGQKKKNSYRQERKKYGIICGVVRRSRAG